MKHFFQIITIVITLFGNSAYASDSMKQFQDNLEKITHQSTASSTAAVVRGGKVFKTKIKAIIFDVDGVVFKTHDESGNYLWSQSVKEDLGLISKHFSLIFSEKWESIIRGKIKLDDHLHAIFQEKLFKDLGITPEQYIQYWPTHDHQVNQSVLDLVKSVKIPCYLGTNQEALRTAHILDTVGSYFKECFASYKIGVIKPEQGFFQHIEKALSLLPLELLLIDDTKNNTLGAQDCGWHVYHYQNDIEGLMDFFKKYEVA